MSFSLGKQLDASILASAENAENPDIIHILDLRQPVLSELQKQALAAAAGSPVTLETEAILDAARQASGLSDYGDLSFRKNLDVWMESTKADADLSDVGRAGVFSLALGIAVRRLRIEDLVRRFPEILEIPIERPLIVAGLPRSGTTYLQSFLAADPRLRSLPYWEASRPVPAPDEVCLPGEADPRRDKCAQEWAQMDAILPYIKAIHEFAPDHISEDIDFQSPEFGTYLLDWVTIGPLYRDHYFATDQLPGYRYIKKCLQVLSFLTGRKRWLLKCPQHMEQLPTLMKVFPDATVVITHRDPVASIQSAVTSFAYSGRILRTTIRVEQIAQYWIERYERLLQACVRDRDSVSATQSVDVYFHELMKDPISIIGKIYAKAGLPLHAGVLEPMEKFRLANQRGKHGQIAYNLERDFGLKGDDIRKGFAFYFDRFPVRAEVK